MRKLAICLAALLVTASPWSGANEAADYPKKTVRIIVPLGPGGAVDVLARLLGARLAEAWGQQFIVENRPGATGSVGASAVSKAPGDGYTLLVTTNSPLTTNLALYQKLDYTIDDFEPVRLLAVAPVALLVQASSPIKTAADFIALAKQPQGVSVATTGNGSIGHFLINEMRRSLGANFVHVPYKGGVPGAAAVVSGESQAGMLYVGAALGFLRDGRLRAIGVVGERRTSALPAVPTLTEIGLPGGEIIAWACIVAPKGTPKPIIDKLAGAIGRQMNDREIADKIVTAGMEPVRESSPEAFGAFLRQEVTRWGKRVQDGGLKIE